MESDPPSPRISFYKVKKTLEEHVNKVHQNIPEDFKVYLPQFSESGTIDHMIESSHFNQGHVLEIFDLFCEFYPGKRIYEEKGVFKSIGRYNFVHHGFDTDGVTPKAVRVGIKYSGGATVISNKGSGRMGPHINVSFTVDHFDQKDVDFNKEIYEKLISKKGVSEGNCIEALIGLGVGYEKDLSECTWDTLAGYEETKREITDKIIRPNMAAKAFQALRERTRKIPRQTTYNCHLLSGTYGVGKTEAGKILANQLGKKFFELSMQSVFTKWYGESSQNLGKIFKYIRKAGDVLLFLDEIDCLSGDRDRDLHEESQRVLAVLMTETAKTKIGDELMIVGATNKPGNLDGAMKRRFKNEVVFPLPRYNDLVKIFQHYAKHLPPEVVEELAKKADGFSPYDVLCVCENAESRFIADLERDKKLGKKLPGKGYYLESLKRVTPTIGTPNPENYII